MNSRMTEMLVVVLVVVLGALTLASCSSAGVVGAEFGGPPRAKRAFPAQRIEGIVYAEARYTDHRSQFGVDLVEAAQVVPIQLKILLRGQGASEAQRLINPARMGLRLVLSDGAVLEPVLLDDVVAGLDEEVAGRVRSASFRGGLLTSTPSEGYVFFALTPSDQFAMSGHVIRHAEGAVVRSVNVADSMLTFNIAEGSEGAQSPFYVGIER